MTEMMRPPAPQNPLQTFAATAALLFHWPHVRRGRFLSGDAARMAPEVGIGAAKALYWTELKSGLHTIQAESGTTRECFSLLFAHSFAHTFGRLQILTTCKDNC